MKTQDWRNIEYLKRGNVIQKKAYQSLKDTGVLDILQDFDPIVVGTIPIGIDIVGSDIDIVCNMTDTVSFQSLVRNSFSAYDSFSDRTKENGRIYVASFKYNNLEIEIYASHELSDRQNGYRHMLVEERILRLAGENFRKQVIALKQDGYKTEPAFGKLLKLENPYQELLRLSDFSDTDLRAFIFGQLKS